MPPPGYADRTATIWDALLRIPACGQHVVITSALIELTVTEKSEAWSEALEALFTVLKSRAIKAPKSKQI